MCLISSWWLLVEVTSVSVGVSQQVSSLSVGLHCPLKVCWHQEWHLAAQFCFKLNVLLTDNKYNNI